MMNITRAKRFTPLRGPLSGRRGGMTTRRSVETLFCTASDSMAESVNSRDELEFTVTDAMLANLTLSPPQTLTQLTVVVEHPKHVTKGRGWVGPLRMRWRTARDDHWRVELPCLQTTAQCCNATGGQSIQSRSDNATAKRKQRRVNQTGEGAV